jgi:hypothetical protein
MRTCKEQRSSWITFDHLMKREVATQEEKKKRGETKTKREGQEAGVGGWNGRILNKEQARGPWSVVRGP